MIAESSTQFSVLMSIYAKEKPEWFDKSLKSVWTDQTLKPSEIILIEDGPLPVDLLNIVDKWKKLLGEKLVLIINSENQGLTKSLNKGLQYVTSKYIARMDSDDISYPERFEKQFLFLEKHPEIAVLGGAVEKIDEFECITNVHYFPQKQSDIEKYICKANPLPHPAVMIRRQIFEDGLRYDERYKKNQDIALWYDVLIKGYKISNLPDIIVKARSTDSLYKRRTNASFNEFKIYMRGIFKMRGIFTVQYIYPISRFIFRLLPVSFVSKIYNSKMYNKFLDK